MTAKNTVASQKPHAEEAVYQVCLQKIAAAWRNVQREKKLLDGWARVMRKTVDETEQKAVENHSTPRSCCELHACGVVFAASKIDYQWNIRPDIHQ